MIKKIAEKLNLSEGITKILVGFCGFILFIIITGTIPLIFHSSDTTQTSSSQKQQQIQSLNLPELDNKVHKEIQDIIRKMIEKGFILGNITYKRNDEKHIIWDINFVNEKEFLEQKEETLKAIAHFLCQYLVSVYGQEQFITISINTANGEQTIAIASFLPKIQKIKIEGFTYQPILIFCGIEDIKWVNTDYKILTDLIKVEQNLEQEGLERVIDGIAYERIDDNSIEWTFNLKGETAMVDEETFKNFARNTCIGLANRYGKKQYVYIKAKLNGIIIAEAKYSPFTDRVEVK